MRRREFIMLLSCAAAIWPLAARAQQPERVRRVGVLVGLAENDPEMKERIAGLRQGLEKLGWVEGSNLRIDYRFAPAGAQARLLARELIALQPDVILTQSTPATAAMQQETRTIPIVFASVADPIGSGFVASLSRPGGNLTGLLQYEEGITGKWLAMLKEIAPNLTRAALVANPRTAAFDYFLQSAKAVAPSLAIDLVPTPVDNAVDIERAIETFAREPNGGLVLPPDTSTVVHRDLIIALAARIACPRFTRPVFSSQRAVSCITGLTSSICLDRGHPMSTASCAVQNPLTFRCRRRRSSKLSSTAKRRRHLA